MLNYKELIRCFLSGTVVNGKRLVEETFCVAAETGGKYHEVSLCSNSFRGHIAGIGGPYV